MNAAALAGHWDVSALAAECAGLGVWEIVAATGIWRCSPRCKELLGIGNDDDPGDALSDEDRRRCTEAIARATRGGEFRLDFRAQDRWLAATGRVVRDWRGSVSIVGMLLDITAQKAALEERELRLGEVAHDLLNPLAAIRLGVHVVRQGGPRAPEMLSRIDAIVSSVERIVAELLDFSRSYLSAPEQATVALSDVCRSVIEEASIVYPGRHVVLSVHDDSIGEWDGGRLRQVVRNLVGNALQHGEPTAPVEISLIQFGDRAVLSVINRGPPVPADLREHLFEPFRRRSSTSRGVGLGLYIVRRIVEAHGGSVDVSSDEARTAFRVTLPRRWQPPQEARGEWSNRA